MRPPSRGITSRPPARGANFEYYVLHSPSDVEDLRIVSLHIAVEAADQPLEAAVGVRREAQLLREGVELAIGIVARRAVEDVDRAVIGVGRLARTVFAVRGDRGQRRAAEIVIDLAGEAVVLGLALEAAPGGDVDRPVVPGVEAGERLAESPGAFSALAALARATGAAVSFLKCIMRTPADSGGIIHGGGGDTTRMLCGFLASEVPNDPIIRVLPRVLKVRITDQGGERPIPEVETPDLEAKLAGLQTPRGWGLFLIQKMVDDLRTAVDEHHHTIELVMHLKEEAPDARS